VAVAHEAAFTSPHIYSFSMNFPFAVFSRALCGLLNGNIGVVKTYLGEVMHHHLAGLGVRMGVR
jgi:hypothetical protein